MYLNLCTRKRGKGGWKGSERKREATHQERRGGEGTLVCELCLVSIRSLTLLSMNPNNRSITLQTWRAQSRFLTLKAKIIECNQV